MKLGPTDGGFTAVLSGLQPGEKVVTDGTDRLRDGVAVTVPVSPQGQTQSNTAQPGKAKPAAGQHSPPPSQ